MGAGIKPGIGLGIKPGIELGIKPGTGTGIETAFSSLGFRLSESEFAPVVMLRVLIRKIIPMTFPKITILILEAVGQISTLW